MKYYSLYTYQEFTFLFIATDNGLTTLHDYTNEDLSGLIENKDKLKPYIEALETYFKTGVAPKIPMDIHPTAFQSLVYNELIKIESGHTTNYEELAYRIKKPRASRAVGNALGRNPILIFIPCHRVIRKDNSIGGFSSNPKLKRFLIDLEKMKLS
ncbi:MAG TPA: methylated-DNA--[protein]-cysteine S-methyltransferase [Acholeplasma sp.]|jgi:O-6-methylguanine DNA methyltransferase|nr:methylated-DNA--[protein]-cysteine S-methyltransferase [Acholeplasma sp.]